MAIYTTQRSQVYGTTYGVGGVRQVIEDGVSVAMTTAMIDNVNDEVELFWVPAGAVIVGITASATDMDSNGTPTLAFDIGDDSDEDRLMAASTIGQAGTLSQTLARTGHMYKYSSATKIKAYVQAAAATAVAGTLSVSIRYFVDPTFSATNAVVS